MKSISSSIVVFAGIFALTKSVPILTVVNSGLAAFAMASGIITLLAGLIALALGLVGWWTSLKYDR
ncbi:MAG: hypothetical protein ABIS50_16450 [Luteolibacter sp.]|uniref:hypothetical protein n=1 Tax=Luteolibacter sp. TaxID=1962973 RepID=UPI003262F7FB